MGEQIVIFGLYFMIYSFVGWCWETPFASIVEEKKFVNRGFLYGPVIPIYAFGIGLMVISINKIKPYFPHNKVLLYFSIWLVTALVATVLEYLVSLVMEMLFKTRWWDYSDMKYNIAGRVCLLYSIGWGVGGCVAYFVIHPNTTAFIYSINPALRLNILVSFTTYFLIDLGLTLKELISLSKVLEELYKISDELKGDAVYRVEIFRNGIGNTMDKITETIDLGQEKLLDSVEKTQTKIKSEFIMLKGKKGIKLSPKQKELIRRYNIALASSRALARFYRSYPRAKSYSFGGVLEVVKNRFRRK